MTINYITLASVQGKNISVPKEFFQKMLSIFSVKELGRAMRVCQAWKEQGEISFKATYGLALEMKGDYTHKNACQFVSNFFKCKNQLDFFINNREEIHKNSHETAFVVSQSETTSKGIRALTCLYKANLVSGDQLKEFTLKCEVWHMMMPLVSARVFVSKGEFHFAKELLEQSKTTGPDFDKLILNMISLECEKNKLEDAFETLKKFRIKIGPVSVKEAYNLILAHADEKNNGKVVEKIIDEILHGDEKFQKVINLIMYYIDNRNYDKGSDLLIKYHKILNSKDLSKLDIHQVIKLYVRLNETKKAQKLAEDNREKDPLVMGVLKRAFEECHMKIEAAKVQEEIDQAAKKSKEPEVS